MRNEPFTSIFEIKMALLVLLQNPTRIFSGYPKRADFRAIIELFGRF
jgi:hypothetical protein